jgi:adhesin/invasin
LSTGQGAFALATPSNSGSATASLNVNFSGGSSNWTAAIFPSNATTSWLKIAPASGSGSGTITLTATATGQALGVYRATVVVQGSNSVPQFIEVPVSFTVGASPDISIGGVAHGASFQHIYAPGMVLSVFGSGLAPAIQLAGVLPLPLSMQGVSATVNGVAAPLYYVSPGQINLQVPYETGATTAVVGINNNGKVAWFPFTTSPTAPGIFVANGNLVPIASGKPGDVLVLFMTGEGDVTPALFTGASPAAGTTVDKLPQPRFHVAVTIAGIDAVIQFEGIPTLLVGTTQINFVIPANVAPGVQPVVVTSNGVSSLAANITVTP